MTKSKLKQNLDTFWENSRRNDSFRLSLVVSMMVLLLFVTNAAADLEPLTKIDYAIVSKASKIILFVLLVCNVKAILRRMTGEKVLGLLFVAMLFGVSFFISRDRDQIWRLLRQYCLTVLPIAVVISCIDDYQVLLDSLVWVSRIIAVCAVALLLSHNRTWTEYSMGLANALTLPAVMLLYGAYRSYNIVDLLLAGTATLVIFVLGSRGALLGIVIFFPILLVMGCGRKDRRLISLVCIALICLALAFWKPLLTWVGGILNRTGSSSRTLHLLLEGNIFKLSRRNELFDYMNAELMARPFAVRGVGGELPFISSFAYAHNLIYELLMDFGVILGGAAVLYILYQAGRTVWDAARLNNAFGMTKLIFFSVSVPLAMFSGTIWAAVYLWCWLVLCDKRYPTPVKLAAGVPGEGKLLSVVVPTRGPYARLLSMIEMCASFRNQDLELVIQDSSDDNREIREYLSRGAYDFVAYHHDPAVSTLTESGEKAMGHVGGQYVCFLKEDDLLSEKLVDFVAYMKQKDIDAAVFSPARYAGPEAAKEGGDHPALILRSFDGQMRRISVKRACRRFLRAGKARPGRMPRLYGGVVRRAVLDQVNAACGAYFSGSDTDMAVSTAMAPFVKRSVFFNMPLIVQGTADAAGREPKDRPHVSGWLLRTVRLGGVVKDDLSDAAAARKYIDEEIGKVPFPVRE